jgi:hypothetical protein
VAPALSSIDKVLSTRQASFQQTRRYQVNIVKTQKRSRMNTDLLDAILYCRFGLSKFNKKVDEFDPPRNVLTYKAEIYE